METLVPRTITYYVNSVLKTIDLGDALDPTTNLQEVAYDKKDDLLWLAIGDTVVAVKKVNLLCLHRIAFYQIHMLLR